LLKKEHYKEFQPLSDFPNQAGDFKFGTVIGGDHPPTVMAFRLPGSKPLRSVSANLADNGDIIVTDQMLIGSKEYVRLVYQGKDFIAAASKAKATESEASNDSNTKFYDSVIKKSFSPKDLREQVIRLAVEGSAFTSDLKRRWQQDPVKGTDGEADYHLTRAVVVSAYLQKQGYVEDNQR